GVTRPSLWRPCSRTTSERSITRAASPARSATSTGRPNRILSVASPGRPCCPSSWCLSRTSLVTSRPFSWATSPRCPRSPLGLAAVSRFAGALGVEAGGRCPLVAAGQPLQRKPPSDRGLPDRGPRGGTGRPAGRLPLHPPRARAGTTRGPLRRDLGRPGGAATAGECPGRAHVDPLARVLEIRRARLSLLPARRRTRAGRRRGGRGGARLGGAPLRRRHRREAGAPAGGRHSERARGRGGRLSPRALPTTRHLFN